MRLYQTENYMSPFGMQALVKSTHLAHAKISHELRLLLKDKNAQTSSIQHLLQPSSETHLPSGGRLLSSSREINHSPSFAGSMREEVTKC